MFKNALKIALRNMRRQKIYSFINLAGLAAGMACCLLIFLWVRNERGFNRFHEKIDRIFLVRCREQYGSEQTQSSGTPPALGPALQAEFPEVVRSARLNNGQAELLMRTGEKAFKEKIQMADPSIFEIFSFSIVKGDPAELTSGPDVMIVSQKFAARRFGREDPVGKTITLDNKFDFRIVGVMMDIPENSSIRFDAWAPLELTRRLYNQSDYIDSWENQAFRTYVELQAGASPETFSGKIAGRVRESDKNTNIEPFVYPFKDVYLKLLKREDAVRMFSLVALLILLMACINFTNLATARSERRAKEVGIRKVVGAERHQLVRQFLGESVLYAFFSLALAVVLAVIVLPVFRSLTGKNLQPHDFWNGDVWMGIVGMTLLTGLISGAYPALVLSSFRPVHTVKGQAASWDRGGLFRKALVLVQSALSILLIMSVLVINSQIRFMKTRNPGFARDYLLYLPVQGNLKNSYEVMKNDLLGNPSIQNAALTTHVPTEIGWNGSSWRWEGKNPNVVPLITYFGVDSDFLKTFKTGILQGRFFAPDASPRSGDVVINERLARIIGLESPVGMQLTNFSMNRNFTVIGVVKDFNFKPLDEELEPLIMFHNVDMFPYRFMFLKISPEFIPRTISFLEKIQRRYNSDFPFEYKFLDEEFDVLYKNEERTGGLISAFMFLAVFISSLGLFGLVSFMAEQRTKEIGIRKVLGASVSGVAFLMSGEFLKWVLIANLVAWPAAYYAMNKWLQNFAYRTGLGVWMFALSGGLALVVALATVSFQAVKAATADPVKALKYE